MKYLVFDVGGTAIKYALIDDNENILEKGEVKTPYDGFEVFIVTLKEIYLKYKGCIKGIAMSMPGKIDSEKGYAHTGGNLEFNTAKEISLFLSKECDNLPVIIENDGKCAAIAEAVLGNLSDVDDGIVMILGTGIGGGIIKNNLVHRGKEFIAGEFSFIAINGNASSEEPLKMFAQECGVPFGLLKPFAEKKRLNNDKEFSGKEFFKMLKNGDKDADEILRSYCYKLSIQLFNLQHIYNPEKIAIGGGISAQDILMEYIEKSMQKVEENMPLILSKPNVVRCKFKNDANLLGALANFKNATK